jgi:UMF1 family MFS transporter
VKLLKNKSLCWALYDWANSAFSTTVMAGFFPLFFSKFWSAGADPQLSTAQLGLSIAISNTLVALMAPLLGSLSEKSSSKKSMMGFFVIVGALSTLALAFIPKGEWASACFFYGLAVLGFNGSLVFYDAMLPFVSGKRSPDEVSALGFSLGYLGGGLLFAVNILMTLYPSHFGLADATQAVQVSFIMVAVWWILFSGPLFLSIRESELGPKSQWEWRHLRASLRDIAATLRDLRRFSNIFLFLAGYWLYIDGVNTIIRMAVDYGVKIGLGSNGLIIALLITQFVAFPATLVFGKAATRFGAKNSVLFGIFVYLGVVLWAYRMNTNLEFYGMAVVIGLVQGGVQAMSRSLFSQLVPAQREGEFFGFFNMVGKFGGILGPMLMSATGLYLGDSRAGVLSLAILFIAGGALLLRVKTVTVPKA